ncbi:sulfite exporter TauE/SafE family protein [Halobacillus faecis]
MIILYFLIGFVATAIGAVTGIGGGVIIKPVLDAIGTYDVGTISTLSAATVFAMAAVSLMKKIPAGMELNWKTSLMLAFGSIIGGVIGKSIFNQLMLHVQNYERVTMIQASVLVVLLLMILINSIKDFQTYDVKSGWSTFVIGLGLGILSAFLGIGGGPLNVAVLVLVFSMNIKTASINSILIIFFSQFSTLVTIFFTTGYAVFDMTMLVYMIAGGVLGGYIGSVFSNKVGSGDVTNLFQASLVIIIGINLFTMTRIVF